MMNIGISAPFNPKSVEQYLNDYIDVPSINEGTTAINILVPQLIKLGHNITVFTTDQSSKRGLVLCGKKIKIVIVPCNYRFSGGGQLKRAKALYDVMKKEISNLDVLHVHWTYEYAIAGKPFASKLPVVCTVRDWAPIVYRYAKGIKEKLYWVINLILFYCILVDRNIVLLSSSTYIAKLIQEKFRWRSVDVIPNPIEEKDILINSDYNIRNAKYVSIASRLDAPLKNIHNLLKGFKLFKAMHRESTLLLIGNYSDVWRQQMEKESLLDGVELLGECKRDEVFGVLSDSTALVHPSYEESFGNTLLEAMSQKTLCIGGIKSGAVPEVLGGGQYGILCDVSNPKAIYEALELSADKKMHNTIVEKATNMLLNKYLDSKVANAHVCVYEKKIKEFIDKNNL